FLSLFSLLGWGFYQATQSPKYRTYIPKVALKAVAHVEKTYVKHFGEDLILAPKSIKAQKIVKNDLRRGRFGMIHERKFVIRKNLVAEIEVESMLNKRVAGQVFAA